MYIYTCVYVYVYIYIYNNHNTTTNDHNDNNDNNNDISREGGCCHLVRCRYSVRQCIIGIVRGPL